MNKSNQPKHRFIALLGVIATLSIQTNSALAEARTVATFSDKCIATQWPPQEADTKAFGALLAVLGPIILPNLFNRSIDFASNRLRDAAGRAQTVKVAQTSGYFLEADLMSGAYKGHSNLKCLIVAHGEIGEQDNSVKTSEFWRDEQADLVDAGLRFTEDPKFYYEGIVHFSEDGQSFKIRTAHVDYDKSIAAKSPRRSAERELAISFLFKDGAGQAFAEGAIPLNQLDAGTTLDAKALGIKIEDVKTESDLAEHASPEYETAWMPALSPNNSSIDRLLRYCEENGCPNEKSDRLQAQPFSLQVQVTESSNTSDILNFLADTLELSKPIASSYLASEVLGSDVYDPFNPEWVAKRNAAYDACIALKDSRAKYQTALESNAAASATGFFSSTSADLGSLNNDVRTAFMNARNAYTGAGLPIASLYADSILNCRLAGVR